MARLAGQGHYFPRGTLTLDVPDARRAAVRGLTVNGRPAEGPPYRRAVEEPLDIEVRFTERAGRRGESLSGRCRAAATIPGSGRPRPRPAA